MRYTKKQFLEDVRKEAKSLRKHSTAEEKERLRVSVLNPSHTGLCIYGQMTGHCRSTRAIELIQYGCKQYLKNDLAEHPTSLRKYPLKSMDIPLSSSIETISCIEKYISLSWAKNEKLISYIKGETNKLVL